MASFNPYAMDPALAQGFSALTKSLIGDAGTDLEVARRKRIETLLPYEVESEKARANASKAAAGASAARAKYLAAQTLTEEGLRSHKIDEAKANAANALKQGELIEAQTKTSQAQGKLYDSQTATEDQRRPFIVAKDKEAVNTQRAATDATKAQERSSIADAMLNEAKTKTENETRQSTVELSEEKVRTQQEETKKVESEARANIAAALKNDAERKRIEELLPGEIEKLRAEIATENAATGEKNANIAKTKAETETQNANTANVKADTNLKNAQAKKAAMTTVPAGHTVFWTDENGKQQTFTAKETTQINLKPNEQVVVERPDGTTQTYTGPDKKTETLKPSEQKTSIETIDDQLSNYFSTDGAFSNVDRPIASRSRAFILNAVKGKSTQEATVALNNLLSQTFDGQLEYEVTTGRNFYVPAFVANYVKQGLDRGSSKVTADFVSETYGLSVDQAQRLIDELKQ